jgi:hypothetical protein
MAEIERGLQWWVRYALVPVLGSGGLAAAVVAYINRPAAAPPAPAANAATPAAATTTAATTPVAEPSAGSLKLVSRPVPEVEAASAAPAPASGCGLAGGRTAWRARYFHQADPGTWHVFVKSLGPNATRAEADRTVEGFRDRFPDLGFLPMATAEISHGRAAYAVVMARGLESQGEAARVAELARDCGVAPDAYFKREP